MSTEFQQEELTLEQEVEKIQDYDVVTLGELATEYWDGYHKEIATREEKKRFRALYNKIVDTYHSKTNQQNILKPIW